MFNVACSTFNFDYSLERGGFMHQAAVQELNRPIAAPAVLHTLGGHRSRTWDYTPREFPGDRGPRCFEEKLVALLIAYADPISGINVSISHAHIAEFTQGHINEIGPILLNWRRENRANMPFSEARWGGRCGFLIQPEVVRECLLWARNSVESAIQRLPAVDRKVLRSPIHEMAEYDAWWDALATHRGTNRKEASSVISLANVAEMMNVPVPVLRRLVDRKYLAAIRNRGTTYLMTTLIQSRFPKIPNTQAYDLNTPPWFFDQRLTSWLARGHIGHKTDLAIDFFWKVNTHTIENITADALQQHTQLIMTNLVGRERTAALDFIKHLYKIKFNATLPELNITSHYNKVSDPQRKSPKRPALKKPTAEQLKLAAAMAHANERDDFLRI